MLVRFTKSPPGAASDTLTCTRPDRSTVAHALPREGVLPLIAIQFVVEETLDWRDGLFGQITAGADFETILTPPLRRSAARSAPLPPTPRQARALAEVFQTGQWSGATDADGFADALARGCRRHRVPAPEIAPGQIDRLRLALRDFGALWRPLAPGASLERTFPR